MNALTELRRTAKHLGTTHRRRDELVREATDEGHTRREVARAARLSVGTIQRIVRSER